jgi:hypothetical protein
LPLPLPSCKVRGERLLLPLLMPFCFAISLMQYASLGNTIQRRLSALQEITEKRMAMAMNVVTMPQTLGTTLGSEKYYSLFGCKSCLLRSVFSTNTAPSPKFRGLIHYYYYYYYFFFFFFFFFFPLQHTLKNK